MFHFDPAAVLFLWQRLHVDYSHLTGDDVLWMVVFNDSGRVVGAMLGEFKNSFDVHYTAACDDPRAVTRKMLRVFFGTLFKRAVRITALIEPGNHRAKRICQRFGFHHEGFMRRGIEGNRDALMYGMLREDCLVLNRNVSRKPLKGLPDGQFAEAP